MSASIGIINLYPTKAQCKCTAICIMCVYAKVTAARRKSSIGTGALYLIGCLNYLVGIYCSRMQTGDWRIRKITSQRHFQKHNTLDTIGSKINIQRTRLLESICMYALIVGNQQQTIPYVIATYSEKICRIGLGKLQSIIYDGMILVAVIP